MLTRTARQCTAPLRSLFSGWGSAHVALQGSSLFDSVSAPSAAPDTAAASSCHSYGSIPLQHTFHSRAQILSPTGDQQTPFRAPQQCSRFPEEFFLHAHSHFGPASSMIPRSALGGVRGAKTAAPQQKSGAKMSKQQLLRQKRRGPEDGPVFERPGIVHVVSTKNNTIITLTDETGNAKAW